MEELVLDVTLDGCVLCGRDLVAFERYDYWGLPLSYDVCSACGLVQMNPRPSPEALAAYYATDYREDKGDLELEATGEHQRLRSEHLREVAGATPARHLDVGCSSGTLLRTIGAASQVGVEPGDQHRALAREAGIEVHESVDALVATKPDPFDLITLSHVLEHVEDPIGFSATLRSLLGAEGRLLVEVPNLYGHKTFEPAHLSGFDADTLRATLGAAGLTVTSTKLHSIPKSHAGSAQAITVLATPGEVVPLPTGPTNVRAMKAKRLVGHGPQYFDKWQKRQRRRVTRNVRKVLGKR